MGGAKEGQLPVCISWAADGISLGVAAGMLRRRAIERGEATLGVADLSWWCGPQAGSLGVADRTSTTGEGRRAGAGAWRLQRHSLEISFA